MKAAVKPLSGANSKSLHQLRIIGGQWRGRKLRFPAVDGLRPTGDRIRETLFNWLAPELPGSRCLDLFAGSGALGLEALSRGASVSVMFERDVLAAQVLRENLQFLIAEGGQVQQLDTLQCLQAGNKEEPYAIAFIDPPFSLNLWQASIDALESGNWLAESASVYIESGLDAPYQVPPNWALHRDKRAGQVGYRLFYREQVDG